MTYFTVNSFAILILHISQVSPLVEDYYWRKYNGSIPADAIIGGQDINNNNIYIGQAYFKVGGVLTTPIFPGATELYATFDGVRKVDAKADTNILCGQQKDFYWMTANLTDPELSLENKRAVIGGHEKFLGRQYIGRIIYKDEHKIGKIVSFSPTSTYLYFKNHDTENRTQFCEMLIFEKNLVVPVF